MICFATLLLSGTLLNAPPHSTPAVNEVMKDVSPERLRDAVDALADFGTRHSLSETASNERGIGAARRWVADQFRAIAENTGREDMEVLLMAHTQPPDRRVPNETQIVNVVAIIPGSMPEARDRRYVMLGHLDSRNTDVMDAEGDAPGANDDASGVAAAIEAARVLAGQRCDATLIFFATSGEEQGLLGANWFVKHAQENDWDIRGALNNDMIGDPIGRDGTRHDHSVRVFSEGIPLSATAEDINRIRAYGAENDSNSRQLARYIAEIARQYATNIQPMLIFRSDRFLRGGDHRPFNEAGIAAVRFTDVYEKYDRQHVDVIEKDGRPYGDVAEYVDEKYLADVTRLNAAVLMSLANAPSSPLNVRMITAELTNDCELRWDAPPEPDVAGYEVVYRATTSAEWEHVVDAANATELTLPLSKDNWLFGVRTYDKDGYRSPVTFAGAARE